MRGLSGHFLWPPFANVIYGKSRPRQSCLLQNKHRQYLLGPSFLVSESVVCQSQPLGTRTRMASSKPSEKPHENDTDADQPDKLAQFLSVGASSPWPAWSMSGLLLASLPTSSRLSTVFYPTGLAPTWQVAPLAMVFGLSGYITSVGDNYNGSGTTSAWSFIYLFLYGRDSWRHTFARPPQTKMTIFPISLTALALTNGIIHGYVYWSGFYRDKLKEEVEKNSKTP